jgi:hypothetical protein
VGRVAVGRGAVYGANTVGARALGEGPGGVERFGTRVTPV